MINNNNYLYPKSKNLLKALSQTEREILLLIKQGLTSTEVAKIRSCSPRTVEKHRSNIIRKLELESSQNTLLVWVLKNTPLLDA